MLDRLRAWRLDRAELALADAEHYYSKWVAGWNSAPSRIRRAKRDIERARRRVDRLRPEQEETPDGKHRA